MSEHYSRRKFLERLGVGAAAGATLPWLKDIAGAQITGPLAEL